MRYFTSVFLLIFVFLSCSKPIDFEQANELRIYPVFEGDMFYLDLYKSDLTDSLGNFRSSLSDTLDFKIFDDSQIRNSFVKTEISIKYTNSFTRRFFTRISYIDDQNQAVAQDTLDILPASISGVEDGEEVFFYSKVLHPDFINFRRIVLDIQISPDSLPVEDKHLHLQAKAKIYTEIK